MLHEVDFNQLKIENQQYIEKIDERNQDLLRLKLMAGNTLQILNSYKASAMLIAVIYRSATRPDNFGWIINVTGMCKSCWLHYSSYTCGFVKTRNNLDSVHYRHTIIMT